MAVIIGVDPHKATHTAVAIGCSEAELARARVRATCKQVPQLLRWADPLGARTWAIESAGGLGCLLAQQLVAAGETVLDVPATLASRIRVLGTGRSDKNDPNDAQSLRPPTGIAGSLLPLASATPPTTVPIWRYAAPSITIAGRQTRRYVRLPSSGGPTCWTAL